MTFLRSGPRYFRTIPLSCTCSEQGAPRKRRPLPRSHSANLHLLVVASTLAIGRCSRPQADGIAVGAHGRLQVDRVAASVASGRVVPPEWLHLSYHFLQECYGLPSDNVAKKMIAWSIRSPIDDFRLQSFIQKVGEAGIAHACQSDLAALRGTSVEQRRAIIALASSLVKRDAGLEMMLAVVNEKPFPESETDDKVGAFALKAYEEWQRLKSLSSQTSGPRSARELASPRTLSRSSSGGRLGPSQPRDLSHSASMGSRSLSPSQITITMSASKPPGLTFKDGGEVERVVVGAQAAEKHVIPGWIVTNIGTTSMQGKTKAQIEDAIQVLQVAGSDYDMVFQKPLTDPVQDSRRPPLSSRMPDTTDVPVTLSPGPVNLEVVAGGIVAAIKTAAQDVYREKGITPGATIKSVDGHSVGDEAIAIRASFRAANRAAKQEGRQYVVVFSQSSESAAMLQRSKQLPVYDMDFNFVAGMPVQMKDGTQGKLVPALTESPVGQWTGALFKELPDGSKLYALLSAPGGSAPPTVYQVDPADVKELPPPEEVALGELAPLKRVRVSIDDETRVLGTLVRKDVTARDYYVFLDEEVSATKVQPVVPGVSEVARLVKLPDSVLIALDAPAWLSQPRPSWANPGADVSVKVDVPQNDEPPVRSGAKGNLVSEVSRNKWLVRLQREGKTAPENVELTVDQFEQATVRYTGLLRPNADVEVYSDSGSKYGVLLHRDSDQTWFVRVYRDKKYLAQALDEEAAFDDEALSFPDSFGSLRPLAWRDASPVLGMDIEVTKNTEPVLGSGVNWAEYKGNLIMEKDVSESGEEQWQVHIRTGEGESSNVVLPLDYMAPVLDRQYSGEWRPGREVFILDNSNGRSVSKSFNGKDAYLISAERPLDEDGPQVWFVLVDGEHFADIPQVDLKLNEVRQAPNQAAVGHLVKLHEPVDGQTVGAVESFNSEDATYNVEIPVTGAITLTSEEFSLLPSPIGDDAKLLPQDEAPAIRLLGMDGGHSATIIGAGQLHGRTVVIARDEERDIKPLFLTRGQFMSQDQIDETTGAKEEAQREARQDAAAKQRARILKKFDQMPGAIQKKNHFVGSNLAGEEEWRHWMQHGSYSPALQAKLGREIGAAEQDMDEAVEAMQERADNMKRIAKNAEKETQNYGGMMAKKAKLYAQLEDTGRSLPCTMTEYAENKEADRNEALDQLKDAAIQNQAWIAGYNKYEKNMRENSDEFQRSLQDAWDTHFDNKVSSGEWDERGNEVTKITPELPSGPTTPRGFHLAGTPFHAGDYVQLKDVEKDEDEKWVGFIGELKEKKDSVDGSEESTWTVSIPTKTGATEVEVSMDDIDLPGNVVVGEQRPNAEGVNALEMDRALLRHLRGSLLDAKEKGRTAEVGKIQAQIEKLEGSTEELGRSINEQRLLGMQARQDMDSLSSSGVPSQSLRDALTDTVRIPREVRTLQVSKEFSAQDVGMDLGEKGVVTAVTPSGQAAEKGVQDGWTVINVAGKDEHDKARILFDIQAEIAKGGAFTIVFERAKTASEMLEDGEGEQVTINGLDCAQPAGIRFDDVGRVTAVKGLGASKQVGVGWLVLSIGAERLENPTPENIAKAFTVAKHFAETHTRTYSIVFVKQRSMAQELEHGVAERVPIEFQADANLGIEPGESGRLTIVDRTGAVAAKHVTKDWRVLEVDDQPVEGLSAAEFGQRISAAKAKRVPYTMVFLKPTSVPLTPQHDV